MADDTAAFLRKLAKRHYRLDWSGSGHVKVYWGDKLVTTAANTPRGGCRSFDNLKAAIRRFERSLEAESQPEPLAEEPSFTCPRCQRTSYHPEDIRQGYCGNCHDWTQQPLM